MGADDALKRHRMAVWKDQVRMAIRGALSEADDYGAWGSDLLQELESELQDLPRFLTRGRGGFQIKASTLGTLNNGDQGR